MTKIKPPRSAALANVFNSIVSKRISSVELSSGKSNQHEINGSRQLTQFFGKDEFKVSSKFFYLEDSGEIYVSDGNVTWYDARANHPNRSEWRLYYTSNEVTKRMREGDLMVIARQASGAISFIIAQGGDVSELQLVELFDLQDVKETFEVGTNDSLSAVEVSEVRRTLLQELEIVPEVPANSKLLKLILNKFGKSFPSSAEFSLFVHSISEEISSPDEQLLTWYNREQECFYALEKFLLQEKLRKGFDTTEDFLQFSLSVHNRRKSRAGYALENHVEALLKRSGINYSRTAVTEGKKKPDFLFPGAAAYRQSNFDKKKLFMLGVKTTCKDRWRQIINEADLIERKHLLTLEGGISLAQLDEMKAEQVDLVVPRPLHASYSSKGRKYLMSLEEYFHLIDGSNKKTN